MRAGGVWVALVGLAVTAGLPAVGPPPRQLAGHDRFGDALEPGMIARLGTVRFRHPTACRAVCYSPDGTRIASCGRGGVVLWDAATGRQVAFFRGQPTRPGDDVSVIDCVAFSPDGRYLAGGPRRGVVQVWEAVTGKLHRPLTAPAEGVRFVAFTADSREVIAADHREVRAGRLAGPAAPGRVLAAAGQWGRAAVVRERGMERRVEPQLVNMALSLDGKTLVVRSADWDGWPVRLVDLRTGKTRGQFDGGRGLALAPDHVLLAVAEDHEIALWDTGCGELVRSWRDNASGQALAFSPDGKTLAANDSLWEVATGKRLGRFALPSYMAESACFSPDGKTLAVSPCEGNAILLWDVATRRYVPVGEAHAGEVKAIACSPDGRTLASSSTDGTLRLWCPKTGKALACLPAPSAGISRLVFSPDGKLLACAAGGLVLVDPATGKVVLSLLNDAGRAFAFSSDGKRLRAQVGLTIRCWDVVTGKELAAEKTGDIGYATLSPDGLLLATNGSEGPVLRDASGKVLRRLERRGPPNVWFAGAFSPDGRLFAAECSGESVVRVWRVADGVMLAEAPWLEEDRWASGAGNEVTSLAFSFDGRSLALARRKGNSRVIELLSGAVRFRPEAGARHLCFTPCGRGLAVAGNGTAVRVWDTRALVTPARLGPEALRRLWDDLASKDAPLAHRAISSLAAAPEQAIPFLAKQLRPAPDASPARVRQLIAELDSDLFRDRQRASAELAALTEAAEAPLRTARAKPISVEARRQLDLLLTRLSWPLSPGRLRTLRAIEALEHAGGPAAIAALQRLARGAPGALETEHARAAVARLMRPVATPP